MNNSIWKSIGYILIWLLIFAVAIRLFVWLLPVLIVIAIILAGVILYFKHKVNKVANDLNDNINNTFNRESEIYPQQENDDYDTGNVIDVDFTEIKDEDKSE